MKKITILITAILFSACVFAQKTDVIPVSKLPKAASDYVSENLPGAKITKASKVEDKGTLTYSTEIDVKGRKHVLIFDKDGKFLRKGDALIESKTPAEKKPASKPPDKK